MKDRTSSPSRPAVTPGITLAELIEGRVAADICWPYSLELITEGLAGAGVRVVAWPKPRKWWHPFSTSRASIIAKGAVWHESEFNPLIMGSDPLAEICAHVAKHWGRVIAKDIEAAATGVPIAVAIEPTFVGARIRRSFIDVIRRRPRMRTRSAALEVMHKRPNEGDAKASEVLISRLTYAFIHGN